MIGPFKPAPGNFKFVFMLIDKFSKWIECMPLVKASSEKAVEFLDQVIHRFGIPNSIITDLGTQFIRNKFWDFCDERSIVVKYVSVAVVPNLEGLLPTPLLPPEELEKERHGDEENIASWLKSFVCI
jgi:hypothetical protein